MGKYQNYITKIREKWANNEIPTLSIAHVYHDDWCKIWMKEECNCNFDIKIEAIDSVKSK